MMNKKRVSIKTFTKLEIFQKFLLKVRNNSLTIEKPKKHLMIICESNPQELPPDVVRGNEILQFFFSLLNAAISTNFYLNLIYKSSSNIDNKFYDNIFFHFKLPTNLILD